MVMVRTLVLPIHPNIFGEKYKHLSVQLILALLFTVYNILDMPSSSRDGERQAYMELTEGL